MGSSSFSDSLSPELIQGSAKPAAPIRPPPRFLLSKEDPTNGHPKERQQGEDGDSGPKPALPRLGSVRRPGAELLLKKSLVVEVFVRKAQPVPAFIVKPPAAIAPRPTAGAAFGIGGHFVPAYPAMKVVPRQHLAEGGSITRDFQALEPGRQPGAIPPRGKKVPPSFTSNTRDAVLPNISGTRTRPRAAARKCPPQYQRITSFLARSLRAPPRIVSLGVRRPHPSPFHGATAAGRHFPLVSSSRSS